MRENILSETRFKGPAPGWALPQGADPNFEATSQGATLSSAPKKIYSLSGPGVHTRNGDAVELHFDHLEGEKGRLVFGFYGGAETAVVTVDFAEKVISLSTSDWTQNQPVAAAAFKSSREKDYVLRLEKSEGGGELIKHADIRVVLNGEVVLSESDLNVLPEMGVKIEVSGMHVLLKRFVHRGDPFTIPEHLHVAAWQMANTDSIEENLASICRGLEKAADAGVELLVTPETSLTGLFPTSKVTRNGSAITAAEGEMRKFIRGLKNAPYVIVGLPVWEKVAEHRRRKTRYNASRLYDPDGGIVSTDAKIHSCETDFWHGYRLQEFDVNNVPISMHICHDNRYPEVETFPVMLGARLILHPSNRGWKKVGGSIDAFEALAKSSTVTTHAFYIHATTGGGSFIVGPQKYDNLIASGIECSRDSKSFPMVGEPQECLIDANIRIHDAFGYWPVRSFRASEEIAAAYLNLYSKMGGRRQ